MELLYLFFKDENKFKNQNLNFGSEFIFNYSVEKQELHVEKNNLYIDNFFKIYDDNSAEILNITSIIGQNGTGKTSILKFIKNNFPSGLELNRQIIFICRHDNQIVIYHTEEFEIKNDLKKYNFKFEKLSLKREKLQGKGIQGDQYITYGYEFSGFENTDLIYFSNVFDFPGGSTDFKGIRDISTNNLIVSDYTRDIENRVIDRANKANYLSSYINNDIHRQVKFIRKFYKSDKILFKLPEELYISIKNDYLEGIESKLLRDNRIYQYLEEFINFSKTSVFSYKNEIERLKFKLIVNIYVSFIVDLIYSYQGLDNYLNINNILKNKGTSVKVEDIIRNLELIDLAKNKVFKKQITTAYFENIIALIKIIDNIQIDSNDELNFDINGLNLKLSDNNYEIFDEFLQLYTGSIIIRPFLNFYWRGISSGEKALLNIYSRFYSLTNDELLGDELHKHLLIMIDEGDLYLHPEWQKRFVKIIVDFLPIVFESKRNGDKRTIQIIFTTNSPIPASDLLSYNTIFLENSFNDKNELITIVKDSLNDQKETFAANIHTLLSDSFFVKGGLIGDFASEKLNKIIDKLIKRIDLSKVEREDMRKLIHQIGEPVLKTKLIQMYNDRFNLDIHERLDNIEKELGI